MFNKINLLDGFFDSIPSLYHLKIGFILLVMMLSVYSAHAGVIANLEAAEEEMNLSQSNSPSTDTHNHLACEMVFFMPLQQFDNGLMIGFSLPEAIYSPLIVQPVVLFGSNNLRIGMPLFSDDKLDCRMVPLLNQEKAQQERQIQEEEYFLLMNNFFE